MTIAIFALYTLDRFNIFPTTFQHMPFLLKRSGTCAINRWHTSIYTQGVPHLYNQEFASVELVIVKVNCWEFGAKFLQNSVDFELLKNKTKFFLHINIHDNIS